MSKVPLHRRSREGDSPSRYWEAATNEAPPCYYLYDIEVWYRGTSLIRKSSPLGPYSRAMSRALW